MTPPGPGAVGAELMRAEAMAAYTRSLLEPLVTRMAEQETTIRDLERENGRLGAELAAEREARSSLEARTGPQRGDALRESGISHWRMWAPWVLTVLAICAVVALLVWPR